MATNIPISPGDRFWRLVVVGEAGRYFSTTANKYVDHLIRCLCDCGQEAVVRKSELTGGRKTDCGRKCRLRPQKKTTHKPKRLYRLESKENLVGYTDDYVEWVKERPEFYRGAGWRWAAIYFRKILAVKAGRPVKNPLLWYKGWTITDVSGEPYIGKAVGYKLQSPDGEIFEIESPKDFIYEHPEWFPKPKSAKDCLTGPCAYYKGWTMLEKRYSDGTARKIRSADK